MIILDANAENNTKPSNNFSLLNQDTTKEANTELSFIQLLKGIELKDAKGNDFIKFLPLENSLELNQTTKTSPYSKTTNLELNPLLTKDITLKELVFDSKKYLKSIIMQDSNYKVNEAKQLPQTLKGLVNLAEKLGIDLKKIVYEDIKPINKVQIQGVDGSKVKALLDSAKLSTNLENKTEIKPEIKTANFETKIETKIVNSEIKSENKAEVKPEIKTIDMGLNSENKTKTRALITLFSETHKVPQKILTQDIVEVKQSIISKDINKTLKTSKEKANETLKLLLRGEKPAQSPSNLTADFSVSTAKVIAPNLINEASTITRLQQEKSFESLLRGDSSIKNADNLVKTEQLNIHKADSFEVKLNEAKQMIKYLSTDVKTAIEDYKSPFSRIKVQLNPQNLGAIDLTVVQRGKNLHINLSSNNAAINALALNVNDLKVQLSNNGINNASFNFNGGSENSSSNSSYQQNSQNRANEEYKYFDNEEQNEEILNSLEIIVPNYV